MPFENFDNKVRQAAEQHHPSYDEKAWAKMEKLLDRELPRGKDRRRIVFFLLLFLLLGGGAWLVIDKPWQKTYTATGDRKLQNESGADSNNETNKTTTGNLPGDIKQNKEPIIMPGDKIASPTDVKKDNNVVKEADNDDHKNYTVVLNEKKPDTTKKTRITGAGINKQEEFDMKVTDPGTAKIGKPDGNIPSVSPAKNDDAEIKKDISKKQTDITPDDNSIALQDKNDETKKNEVTGQSPKANEKNKANVNKSKKSDSFFFTFSAGPDLSYIQLGNPGKLKLLAGAGIGYTIKNRVTIRTGFYTARKVYTAAKDEYKPSVQPPSPYLDRIDADCKIYEIPLSLAYHFGKSEKQNMFASAGLSSLIMKKETYDYIYLYPGNPVPYVHTKTIENKYEHYFSVLTISGGYQRKISKVLSLSAEPYVKLPLGGVGYGRVKLSSAGVLFSAVIKPFN